MKRRDFIAGIAAAAVHPFVARGQTAKIYRLGYLSAGTHNPRLYDFFQRGLKELGWIEGQNIAIERRYAEGQPDRLPDLARELVALKIDLIVASPTVPALAARNATDTIPIVGIGFDNPLQHGLAANLARPGGNVTGLSYAVGPEIFGKDLELLKELVPGLTAVAVVSNPEGPNHGISVENIRTAARSLGVDVQLFEVRRAENFDDVFAEIAHRRMQATLIIGDPMYGVHQTKLTELALRYRLPAMHTNRVHVENGGLMCYGPSFPDLWRRAASYVDKILKGAKPADLPIEQPTKFELIINLKTAKGLGLQVPPTLLTRADEVIE
jgi:putative tryptophan/tyrosine transport system substrate-binding protein